jgi:hypothetical protein
MIRIHSTGGSHGDEHIVDIHLTGSAQDFMDAHDALDLAHLSSWATTGGSDRP